MSYPSTALLSFFTLEYYPLSDIVTPVKDIYCKRHGYYHLIEVDPYRANGSYYAYNRLRYIYDLFFGDRHAWRGLEVILCANVHTQIMTHSVTIESFLEEGKDLYITCDPNGLNAGVFIIRKSEWTRRWLEMLLSKEEQYANHPGHEQQAMADHWQLPEWRDGIKQVDQVLLNSYRYVFYNNLNRVPPIPGEFEKGRSFIFHCPGRSVYHPEPTPLVQTRCAIFSSPEITDNIVY